MTVEGLAAKAAVSPGLISQIENGISNGSPDSLQKLAAALGCTYRELFDDPIPGQRRLDVAVPEQDFDRIHAAVMALIRPRIGDA
jgi:transcriptional regulator with XRE-family HTH domain